eukprot:5650632-Pleurochrysis_carterae.AAC.1
MPHISRACSKATTEKYTFDRRLANDTLMTAVFPSYGDFSNPFTAEPTQGASGIEPQRGSSSKCRDLRSPSST